MGKELGSLVDSVEKARKAVLDAAGSLSPRQGAFKAGDGWSVAEVVEHLYLAELFGISKIWSAVDDMREGPLWSGDLPNRGKRIEQIIDETWRPREEAPPIATPRGEDPLHFWLAALGSLRPILRELAVHLDGVSLEKVVFPHFLSGPLDARQRLEFLRYHMERHLAQIIRIKEAPGFPH